MLSFTIVVVLIQVLELQIGGAKVILKRLGNCDPNANYSMKLNVKFKNVGDKQYVDATAILTEPFGDSIRSNVSVDMIVAKQYIHLFYINEKKSCSALNKYLGEFWYDIERNLQIIPGLCPIAKGRYQSHNYLLDFDKMATVNNFPVGNLRLTDMVYDKGNKIYTCAVAEVENHM